MSFFALTPAPSTTTINSMAIKAKNPKLMRVSGITMYIIGRKYYQADAARDESIYFQRDPDNEDYPDAILALNEAQEVLGFLARKNTEFLAPLMDEGKISLTGTVTAQPEETFIPITADVYLHKKGKHIFKPIDPPLTKEEMIHEIVRRFFDDPGELPAEDILNLRERFKEFVKGDTLPETKLLVKMLPELAKEQEDWLREPDELPEEYPAPPEIPHDPKIDAADTLFSMYEITSLRKQAAKARRIPEDNIPNDWSISPVDPMKLVSVFPCLKVKDGYYLAAYQYRSGGNGNGFVYAIPCGTSLRPPEECPRREDHFLNPPQPECPLDSCMEAIEGDGTPLSYLSASILGRELDEFGAMWHGCSWSDSVIIGSDPWAKKSRHLFSMTPISPKKEWEFLQPEPDDWSPAVFMSDDEVTVRFYVWSGLGGQTISMILDTYVPGNYCFKTKRTVIAEGGGGFVY